MGSSTTRLALLKPDPTDLVNVITQINNNYDKLDQWLGAILVNDGVTPPDASLYDGAIVKEKNSGIVWMAQWNGVNYDKKYIVYPWLCSALGSALQTGIPTDQTFRIAQINTVTGVQVNSTGALRSLGTNNFTIDLPIKAIYHVSAAVEWGVATAAVGAQDYRAVTLWRGSTAAFDGAPVAKSEYFAGHPGTTRKAVSTEIQSVYNAGESIRVGMWQTSGASRDVGNTSLSITLINPVS